jgi:hypothetical protein
VQLVTDIPTVLEEVLIKSDASLAIAMVHHMEVSRIARRNSEYKEPTNNQLGRFFVFMAK